MKKYWPTIRDYLLIIIAALIQALSLRLFFVPANLASGGVSGISQLINHFTGWPIGLMILLGNIPLFVLGWRFLGGYRFAAADGVCHFHVFRLHRSPGADAVLCSERRGDQTHQ